MILSKGEGRKHLENQGYLRRKVEELGKKIEDFIPHRISPINHGWERPRTWRGWERKGILFFHCLYCFCFCFCFSKSNKSHFSFLIISTQILSHSSHSGLPDVPPLSQICHLPLQHVTMRLFSFRSLHKRPSDHLLTRSSLFLSTLQNS